MSARAKALLRISGYSFCDRDLDGVWDRGESGAGGMLITILDEAGKVVTETHSVDAPGKYNHGSWLVRLNPGVYTVRQGVVAPYVQTVPAGDEAGYRIQVQSAGGYRLLSARPKGFRGLNFGGIGEACRRCAKVALFSSNRTKGEENIYRTTLSGQGAARLTRRSGNNASPALSPWASTIAFASDRDGNWEIYTMGLDGAKQANVTQNEAADQAPSWGIPWIAFQSDRDGNMEIYQMMPDGSQLTRLTDDPAADVSPSWSPEGTRLAFASDRDGNWEIYVLDTLSGKVQRVTDDKAEDREPTWSPDGQWIVFASDRDGQFELYKVKVADGALTRLTDDPAQDRGAVWAPYCEEIYFQSDRSGEPRIYHMKEDDSEARRLEKLNRAGLRDALR